MDTTVRTILAFEDGDKVFLQIVSNFAGTGEQVQGTKHFLTPVLGAAICSFLSFILTGTGDDLDLDKKETPGTATR